MSQNTNMPPSGTLFKRNSILVADLERSLTVYRDILGFTIDKIDDSSEDSFSYPVFKIPKTAKVGKFATLDSPTQKRALALTEITGMELPKPQLPIMSSSVIQVKDLPAVIKKIQALGLETTYSKTDSNDFFEFIEQAFIDFDGHLVVIYELLPNKK